MHEPELPDSVVNAIEQRVKRRLRRHMRMAGLTFVLGLTVVGGIVSPAYADKHTWGTMTALLLVVWIPYTLWYLYRTLAERLVRREIERERAHQLRLARESGRLRREERYTHLTALTDDREAVLADDGELWFDDEIKPKRHFES